MKVFLFAIIVWNVSCIHALSEPPTNSELFNGKKIVVMGGTGYLGRAIIKHILEYEPAEVVVFSRDEVKHSLIPSMFGNNPIVRSALGDVRDYASVLEVTRNADIVFHIAALKRIDLLESNVIESIKTNILGSVNVFNAAIANDVPTVLFISTDKACLPINAYGGCKFVSEKVFTNYDKRKVATKFIATRFGNILESTGSVIPLFVDKIKKGEDITLTDPDMTRFIICKEEAVTLICDALRYSSGGEIFVKRLPALRIVDLIDVLIESYNGNNNVTTIGLRPGEKLHEVLINASEIVRTVEFNGYLIIRSSVTSLFESEDREPWYMRFGKPLDTRAVHEYSSDQSVIAKDELKILFKELGIL